MEYVRNEHMYTADSVSDYNGFYWLLAQCSHIQCKQANVSWMSLDSNQVHLLESCI